MLPKKNRLGSDFNYRKVKRFGRTYRNRLFNLAVLETTGPVSRVGIITSRRLDKRAVVRNRARRILNEAIRTLLPEIAPVADIVIVVKREMVEKNLEQILFSLKRALREARVLSP